MVFANKKLLVGLTKLDYTFIIRFFICKSYQTVFYLKLSSSLTETELTPTIFITTQKTVLCSHSSVLRSIYFLIYHFRLDRCNKLSVSLLLGGGGGVRLPLSRAPLHPPPHTPLHRNLFKTSIVSRCTEVKSWPSG